MRHISVNGTVKLRSSGYRLVYEVEEKEINIYVIFVGRRDTIYKILKKRKLCSVINSTKKGHEIFDLLGETRKKTYGEGN